MTETQQNNLRQPVAKPSHFYVTAPTPCPYLEGRMERKLFTQLAGKNAQTLHNGLAQQGFRRSQNILYRPSCIDCAACLSVRIDVGKFIPSKSQRRILRKNKHLTDHKTHPRVTLEHYRLFSDYIAERHSGGGMSDMDRYEFGAMIEESPVDSLLIEYRDHDDETLIAASMTDVLQDGLSMVYSYFAPNHSNQSPGTYMILNHIDFAQKTGLPYVYLGYWIPGSKKMEYKSNFSNLEIFIGGQWHQMNTTLRNSFRSTQDNTQPADVELTHRM